MPVSFGEWLPDLPDFQNPGATEAKNVYADALGYNPFQDLSVDTDLTSLGEIIQGKPFAVSTPAAGEANPSKHIYAGLGDDVGVYVLAFSPGAAAAIAWENVPATTTTGVVTVDAALDWHFAQFGTLIIAANGSQSLRKVTPTNYQVLGGSPPIARYVAIVGDFVVAANISTNQSLVQWSGINDAESWAASATTQADSQALPDGGIITGIVGGQFGVIFQEFAIRRQTYIGSPLIFQFDVIANDFGCRYPSSIAEFKEQIFFLSDHGFAVVLNGQQVVPIGHKKVDGFFRADLLPETATGGNANPVKPKVIGIVDPKNERYLVAYPSASSTPYVQDRLLIYDIQIGRWSRAEVTVESLGVIWKRVEDGSADYLTNELVVCAFNTSHKLGYFDGANLAATIETTEAQIFPGRRAFVNGIRPIVDGGSDSEINVQLATRSAPNDAVTFMGTAVMGPSGLCSVRSSGRFHRARVNIAAGASWTHATGVDVEAVPEGKR
jgi:hypothetical protein